MNARLGKEQYVVPYLMSSHPGSTMKEAVELAEYLRDLGYMPEQVQDFYPTPSTISTCMYYTGLDPRTMEPVYVPKSPHEKAMQRALIQYRNPKNYELVEEALKLAHREDLIGFDKKCLIRPRSGGRPGEYGRGGASGKGGNGGYVGKTEGKPGNGGGKSGGKAAGNRATNGSSAGKMTGKATGQGAQKSATVKKKTIRNVHKKKTK